MLLIVNVASKCGLTPQYKPLEAIHEKYKDKGFAVLGFPCNQFGGQEPGNNEQIKQFAAFSFPRLSWYCGRWIRHGDWYPDRCTRLWRRGQAEWAGGDVHEKLKVNGPIGRLSCDLHHYSRESINAHLQKIIPFSDEFVRQHVRSGDKPGCIALAVRPFWRFLRAYFFRLGLLDGWPGYYIACHTAFSTVVRYAKVREALEGCSSKAAVPATPGLETHPKKLAR